VTRSGREAPSQPFETVSAAPAEPQPVCWMPICLRDAAIELPLVSGSLAGRACFPFGCHHLAAQAMGAGAGPSRRSSGCAHRVLSKGRMAANASGVDSQAEVQLSERTRETVEDGKIGPKEPRSTVVAGAEEAAIVAFRRHRPLPWGHRLERVAFTCVHASSSNLLMSHVRAAQYRFHFYATCSNVPETRGTGSCGPVAGNRTAGFAPLR